MPTQTKISHYTKLLAGTVSELNDTAQWQSFLETSARLYKYKFADQAMIHAQRPTATACADYNLWRRADVADRQVMRGSKGIALIDDNGQQIRYVFDYADTQAKSNKAFKLWQIDNENEKIVTKMLKFRYAAESNKLDNAILEAAKSIAAEYSGDYANELIDYTEGSLLEELDNFNVFNLFSKTLENSLAYGLLSRCGYNPADYFNADDFEELYNFNTLETMTILGRRVSELSENVLRNIERTVKNYERNKTHEHSNKSTSERENNRVQPGQGDRNATPELDNRSSDFGEIRTNESELSQTKPPEPIRNNVDKGDIKQPLDGNRNSGEQPIRADVAAVGEVGESDRGIEIREPIEMGGADEQPQNVSRGNNPERTDIQVAAETGGFSAPDAVFSRFETAKAMFSKHVIFTRLGDFYEAYEEDARLLSELTNMTLTNRKGVTMCFSCT